MPLRPVRILSQWIQQTIADPEAGESIPTIRELAHRFNLSPSSIKKCMKPYIKDGTLTTIRGRGTFITARMASIQKPHVSHVISSEQSIVDALTDDIATGKLKQGEALPAIKLIINQFKTGHATVTRAYRLLEQKGLARKVGRNFWVGGLQSIRTFGARKSIAWFNFSEGDPTDLTAGNDFGMAYQTMEHELVKSRLVMRIEDCTKLDLFLRSDAFRKNDAAGYAVTGVTKTRFDALLPSLQALGSDLKRSGKRILMCGCHSTAQEKLPGRIHYFCHGTIITNVVRTAADACFKKGFQKIVLLFRETEDNLGSIRFFVRFISELLFRNMKARITFLIEPVEANQTPEDFFKRTPAFKGWGTFEYLEGLLSKYAPLTMNDLFGMVTLRNDFDDLLSQAPRNALWLTTTSSTAISLLDWCSAQRIAIPHEAGLLCFDIDPVLRYRGIASCLPDWHTIGYIMAHALIGDIPNKKSRKGYLQAPAILYERSTLP